MTNGPEPNAQRKRFRGRQISQPSAAMATIEPATDALSDHPFGKSPTEAAPIGYISTKTAIREAIADRLDLLDALLDDLQKAIVERRLVPELGRVINGERVKLDSSFWKKPLGFESISDGVVSHLALEPADMRLANALLYFEQSKWNTWISAWYERMEKAAAVADVKVRAEAWLPQEMVRRAETGEDRRRPAMVVALTTEFTDLPQREAKDLIKALKKQLRPRRGPRKGSLRVSAQK